MTDGVSRRAFLGVSGTLIAARKTYAAEEEGQPWYRSIQRCGQTNLNEKDLTGLGVEGWAEYWASLKVDVVLLNGGGIVAYYPTNVPYHHRSQFLGDRDVLGEFIAAVRRRGMRVVARMDPNFAWEDALRDHPEWFQRDPGGKPRTDPESTWLYRTCMFSNYFTEQLPKIFREVSSRYDIDGFFTNGWPTTGAPVLCYCENCARVYREKAGGVPERTAPSDPRYRKFFDVHMDRILEIWRLWDETAKVKNRDGVFYGNLHTNLRAVKDLTKLAEAAQWFNLDGQDRGGDTNPLWYCSQQVRAARSAMKGRTVTNVCGAYASTNYMAWRHTSKAPEEATLWLAATVAAGAAPTYHWLGGSPVDNRWRDAGREFYQWMARHSDHFRNVRTLADIGMVYSQRTLAFYGADGPRAYRERREAVDHFQGLYYALLEDRCAFDFVHENDLSPETLRQYRALILPNVANLGDRQCVQLREYVRRGGSVLATYETSLYNEWGDRRKDFGLADVLGVTATGDVQGPLRNSYGRVEKPNHEILSGIGPTELLPGAVYRVPVRLAGEADTPLSYMPPFPSHPPEMVYPRIQRTDEPALVLRETGGGGRVAYFPGDVDRTLWRTSNVDLDRLLRNAIRWVRGGSGMRGPAPVEVRGDGVLEIFAWETKPGFAVHLLNYTNPHMLGGWVREFYPVGRQEVRLSVPEGIRIAEVRALRAGRRLPFEHRGGLVRFDVPQVVDYEVAAVVRG